MLDSNAIESTWRAFERQPDAATFEALHTATRDLAARIAWRALGDSDWMEDAMQALYARLWQDRATRRIPAGISAREALIRWTLNECRTINRRRNVAALREAPIEAAAGHPTGAPGPAEAADHRLVAEAVRRILATLPDPYREALLACEIEGATHAEAGNILGLPARTVQTHVRRGKELLTRKLRKAGITLPAGAALALYASDLPATVATASCAEIIANAPTTVATAGAIVPSEGAAATGGMLSLPAIATAAACVAGAAVLVWALAAQPQNPSSLDTASTPSTTSTQSMESAPMGIAATRTDTAVAGTDTTPSYTNHTAESPEVFSTANAEITGAGFAEVTTPELTAPIPEDNPRTGRVISTVTGQGIANVEVGLGSDVGGSTFVDSATFRLDSPVMTDEQGYFHLANLTPDRFGEQSLAAVHARGEGLASRSILIIPQMFFADDSAQIEIPMPPGGSITGTLYGPSGATVADALVGFPFMGEVNVASAMEKGYFISYGSMTKTNSDGEFTLDHLPAGESIDIPIIPKDLPARFEDDILVGTRDHGIIIEEPGHTLRGTVTREGAPVEGVTVSTRPIQEMQEESQNFFRSMVYSRSAKSGPDGRFEIRGLAAEEHRGGTFSPEGLITTSFDVVVRSGQDATVDIELPAEKPEPTITYLAKDHATDQPIPGVRISLQSFMTEIPGRKPVRREPSNVAITNQDGLATLTIDARHNSQYYVLPPEGWVHFDPKTGARLRWNPLQMPSPGSKETQTLHFARGEILRGRVLDVDGETLDPEAWIYLSRSDYPIDIDDKGRFEIAFAPKEPRLFAIHGRRGGLLVEHADKQESADTDFVLQPYAMISGKVEDTDGSAVGMLALSIHHIAEPNRGIKSPISFAITSADGRFMLRNVVPGRVRITTNTTADAPSRIANLGLELDLAAGEVRRDVLIKPEAGRTFEGVVTDENAEPLPGVNVYLHPRREPGGTSDAHMFRGRTDADGYWRITDAPEKPIESVQFSHERYNSAYQRAEEGQAIESPVNAMLSLQNEVRLRLIDADTGQPVARYTADFFVPRSHRFPGSFSPQLMVADAEGLSPATRAQKGDLAVHIVELNDADEPTGRSNYGLFNIGSGGETEIQELRIGSVTYPVTGNVGLIPGWHPVEGARVTVSGFRPMFSIADQPSPTSDGTGPEAFTDAEGNFTIHLGPGAWQLIAAKEGHWCVSLQTVTVTDGPAALEHRIAMQVLPSPAPN